MKKTNILLLTSVLLLAAGACSCEKPKNNAAPDPGPGSDSTYTAGVYNSVTPISMESLLDEIISYESATYFPSPSYSSKQFSSYDRRSRSPQENGWYANQDNNGYVRIGTFEGRSEKVIFEQNGPGVITRIWTAGVIDYITLRFYFDGEKSPRMSISGYDMTKTPFAVPDGLVLKHQYYSTKGGATFFMPIPYGSKCIVTGSDPNMSYAYHFNYRTYEPGTEVKTFSVADANALNGKMNAAAQKLKHPVTFSGGTLVEKNATLAAGNTLTVDLPEGQKAVKSLAIKVSNVGAANFSALMRRLIVKITFDGEQTVWAPLSDFSGGGIGAPAVSSWYMSSNGTGSSTSRWVMPYSKNAKIEIENISQLSATVEVAANVDNIKWYDNSLYFHCSWRQERGLATTVADLTNNHSEWNFSTLSGKGVYKGDVLSVHNSNASWYGEGDEKIYIDNETFPSHFGTGTEDYYNTSFAPIVVFHTPFGGAPRADKPNSQDYNAFLRTRNLDGITFNNHLKFDFELLSWVPGTVTYASTVFWYGGKSASAIGTSNADEAKAALPSNY